MLLINWKKIKRDKNDVRPPPPHPREVGNGTAVNPEVGFEIPED